MFADIQYTCWVSATMASRHSGHGHGSSQRVDRAMSQIDHSLLRLMRKGAKSAHMDWAGIVACVKGGASLGIRVNGVPLIHTASRYAPLRVLIEICVVAEESVVWKMVNCRAAFQCNAMHWSFGPSPRDDLDFLARLSWLYSLGGDPNCEDKDGGTCLHRAAICGLTEVCKWLIIHANAKSDVLNKVRRFLLSFLSLSLDWADSRSPVASVERLPSKPRGTTKFVRPSRGLLASRSRAWLSTTMVLLPRQLPPLGSTETASSRKNGCFLFRMWQTCVHSI